MYKGLSLIPQLIIDTHFIQRGRFGRITEAVAQFPKLIGIGLAEDTGLIIKNGTLEVIGSGMVIVFNGRKLKHNNHPILETGTPMSLTNLKTHILSNGDRFNINKKKVKVLPIEAPFI
jgi:cyanophycinase